jgi:hypothetical protein
MAEKAQHGDKKDKGSFTKGKAEAPRAKDKERAKTVKDTAKTREAKASKGGRESNR